MSKSKKGSDELPELKEADVARILMGTASEVCSAMGVTVKFDIQIVEPDKQPPEAMLKAIKRLTMFLSHVVERQGLTEEYIKQALADQSKGE